MTGVFAFVSDLDHCIASDLASAMRKAERHGSENDLVVADAEPDYWRVKDLSPTMVSFVMNEGRLMVEIIFTIDNFDDEDEQIHVNEVVLSPFLRRNRLESHGSWLHEGAVSPPWVWQARFGVNPRGRTLGDLYRLGLDAIALLEAAQSGTLTRDTTADLIRAGQAQVLIGQPEGHWLDVKQQHYDLGTPHGQISLAQAVSRFCNAEDGGLVVVGMDTKRVPGGEVIRSLCPVNADGNMIRRYQNVIENRLYPPPDNMSIEAVACNGAALVLIDIPPQPEELKPFLVHGAIVDGRVEGAFISIVRRRGEGSIPITAPMIHSALAAGRALLRRGELPSDRRESPE